MAWMQFLDRYTLQKLILHHYFGDQGTSSDRFKA